MNRFGDFLRAQREQVTPQPAGLPVGGTRRVAGLRREEVAEEVAPELLQLMDAAPQAAAYVTNPAFRVLLANPTAIALIAPVNLRPDMLSTIFLEPTAEVYYVNWDEVSRAAVSALRHSTGFVPTHPGVLDLVAELTASSPAFLDLWNDQTVTGPALTRKTIHHPAVGVLHLNYQTFDVRSAPGQQLTVATAEPGSPSATALAHLLSP